MSATSIFSLFLSCWSAGFFSSLLVVYVFLFFRQVRGVARCATFDIRGS